MRFAEHMARCEPALFHRSRGKRGKSDDIAGGVDVRDGGLERFVDGELAAFDGAESHGGEVEAVGVGLTSHGIEKRGGGESLAAFEGRSYRGFVIDDGDGCDLFAEPEGDAGAAKLIHQRLRDLFVDMGEQRVAGFDDRDGTAERGDH